MAVLLHIEDVITGNTFGERLRNARVLSGLSAQEVADKIGVKYPTYMSYETKGKQPRQEKLVKISETLHVSTDQLLGTSFTQYGQLEHGRLISLPVDVEDDGHGPCVKTVTDIAPILSAVSIAVFQNFAEYYDAELQEALSLEDDDLVNLVLDTINGLKDSLHKELLQELKDE